MAGVHHSDTARGARAAALGAGEAALPTLQQLSAMSHTPPPLGRVTFLFTDIEGSTHLLERLGESAYGSLLAKHHRLLREAFHARGGYEVDTQGDAFFVAFATPENGAGASADAQRALARSAWPEGAEVRVRIGVLTGRGNWVGERYVGIDVHRAARIAAAAHGGQVVVCDVTRDAVEAARPAGVALRDLGHHRLKDLARSEHLYQLVVDGLPADFPPLRTLEPPNNLPTPLTSFVGRADELFELVRLLSESRLITLTGPGGTGKTRLGVQVASSVVRNFRDGVYFVSLAAIDDPTLVADAIARVLPLQESDVREPTERLGDYLVDKHLLLLLDNFEQIADAASLVSELLAKAPHLRIVVTSRAPLHVYGEREYPVEQLPLPADEEASDEALMRSGAVILFVERARAVLPSFALTAEHAPAVAQIVTRLDGLPLAIELAAARTKLLPPKALLARLTSRLDALQGGPHGVPARHQTMRAAIDWSYDLLNRDSQRSFIRFGAFAGGAELEEAEAVCAPGEDIVERLTTLVDESLLKRIERIGEPRFLMLQTIREFALERLRASGEEDDALARHAHAFLVLAEQAEPHLTGAEPKPWLDRLDADHENFGAALRHAAEVGDARTSLRLVAALWRYWQMRGHLSEAREHATRALMLPRAAETPRELARALEAAGGICYWQGDFEAARGFYGRALAEQRLRGDAADVANALYNLSFTYSVTRADPEAAQRYVGESLALYRNARDQRGTAKALFALGNVSYFEGELEPARAAYAESLRLTRELDDAFALGWSLYMLALALQGLGHSSEARDLYREAFEVFSASRDFSGSLMCLNALADVASSAGDVAMAARLAGAAAALEAKSGAGIGSFAVQQEHRDPVLRLREVAPEPWGEGEELGLEDAIHYILDR
jgi:predicted ATPase/class 3 adenylate cyclase